MSRPVVVGVAPMRLTAPGDDDLPRSVADDAHDGVVEVAIEWHQTAGVAHLWEAGATVRGAERDRAYVLAGPMASVGEQLALAHAAAVEVARWRAWREVAEPSEAHEMSMRGMAEAHCLFVIGAGHALANVAIRALALHPDRRAQLSERFARGGSAPTFAPFSSAPRDWVSMGPATSRKLQAVARGHDDRRALALVQPVAAVGLGAPWHALTERRGEDFHRWRPQSHGVAGVRRRSPWKVGEHGASMGLGSLDVHEESRGLADRTAEIATAGMLALADAMRAYQERWPAVSPSLGGPRFGRAGERGP